eukprot:89428_1
MSYQHATVVANGCDPYASCHNNFCLLSCSCKHGWFGNGTHCVDICTTNPCHSNALCQQDINSQRGYQCHCQPGFYFEDDGFLCNTAIDSERTDQWNLVDDVFKQGDYAMIAAYDESYDKDIIVLLGGNHVYNRYVFNMSINTIINISAVPNLFVTRLAQNYATVNSICYFNWAGEMFGFGLLTSKISKHNQPIFNVDGQCICTDGETNVYAIGGVGRASKDDWDFEDVGIPRPAFEAVYKYLQIFNTKENGWLLGPLLPFSRGFGACTYSKTNDSLYYFGGYETKGYTLRDILSLSFVHSIDMHRFLPYEKQKDSWELMHCKLTASPHHPYAIIIPKQHLVMILGDMVGTAAYPFCNIFDLSTDRIQNCQSLMNVLRTASTGIYTTYYNMIYMFGGIGIAKKRELTSIEYHNVEYTQNTVRRKQNRNSNKTKSNQKFSNSTLSIQQWTLVDAFDVGCSNMILGYNTEFDKHKIIILGGQDNVTSRYVFDIPSKRMMHDPKELTLPMSSTYQSYVSLKHNIYWRTDRSFLVFNMLTSQIMQIPSALAYDSSGDCLTSDGDTHIYLIGSKRYEFRNPKQYLDYEYDTILQIYNVKTDVWIVGPKLQQPRSFGSCTYWKERDTLYYFGGQDTEVTESKDAIELLFNLSDSNASWKISDTTLTRRIDATFAFIQDIYRTVFIMRTTFCNEFVLMGESVRECTHNMNILRYDFSAVFSRYYNMLFVFGGKHIMNKTKLSSMEYAYVAPDSHISDEKKEL